VLPGTYQVAWCMDLTRVQLVRDTVKLFAGVEPSSSSSSLGADSGSGKARGATSTSATGSSSSTGSSRPRPSTSEVVYQGQQMQVLEQRAVYQGQVWGWVCGGQVTVREEEAPATVQVRFYSHTSTWKAGMRWAFAQLLPIGEEGLALPPLAQGDEVSASGSEWETDEEEREARGALMGLLPPGCAQQ